MKNLGLCFSISFCALLLTKSVAQVPQLLKDINTLGTYGQTSFYSSNEDSPASIGTIVYFVNDDNIHGAELWRSDGTAAGTYMLKDIKLGSDGSKPKNLTVSGSVLYFSADNGQTGYELWKTDGTTVGTVMVKEINPAYYVGSDPTHIIAHGGGIYFSADDGTNGRELWESDGTAAGTKMLANINPGSASSNPTNLINVPHLFGYSLYYIATTATNGQEIWRTSYNFLNTVPIHTLLVETVVGAGSQFPQFLTLMNNALYFVSNNNTANSKINRYDFSTLTSVGGFTSISEPFAYNNILYFEAGTTTYGRELWKAEYTSALTATLLKDINPGTAGTYVRYFTAYNGQVFFNALSQNEGYELWRTDGMPGGTILHSDWYPGNTGSNPEGLIVFNNELYFSANHTSTYGRNLYKISGLGAPILVKTFEDDYNASSPYDLITTTNALYYRAYDSTTGIALWKTDATATGAVKTLSKGVANARKFYTHNNTLFFVADTSPFDMGLWRTDGTTAGTQLVKSFQAKSIEKIIAYNGFLYFFVWNRVSGFELWRTDGTVAGTTAIKYIPVGFVDIYVTINAVVENNKLFFIPARDGFGQLWTSDGTTAGTAIVDTRVCGPDLVAANGYVYFSATATDLNLGHELYATNGFVRLSIGDINPGSLGSFPRDFTLFQNKIYFSAQTYLHGRELWRYDPFAIGAIPERLTDIVPNAGDSSPFQLTAGTNRLFFSTQTSLQGTELASFDPTTNSISIIDTYTGSVSSSGNPLHLYAQGNYVYYTSFSASAPSHRKVFKSNGATNNYVALCNLPPASENVSNAFGGIVGRDNTIFFNALLPTHGIQLFRNWSGATTGSNPAQNSTTNMVSVNTEQSSYFDEVLERGELFIYNNALYFTASNGVNGFELYKYELCPTAINVPQNMVSVGTLTHQASGQITSAKSIQPISYVSFQAGQSILLQPGFQIAPALPNNSTFKAEIKGCTY